MLKQAKVYGPEAVETLGKLTPLHQDAFSAIQSDDPRLVWEYRYDYCLDGRRYAVLFMLHNERSQICLSGRNRSFIYSVRWWAFRRGEEPYDQEVVMYFDPASQSVYLCAGREDRAYEEREIRAGMAYTQEEMQAHIDSERESPDEYRGIPWYRYLSSSRFQLPEDMSSDSGIFAVSEEQFNAHLRALSFGETDVPALMIYAEGRVGTVFYEGKQGNLKVAESTNEKRDYTPTSLNALSSRIRSTPHVMKYLLGYSVSVCFEALSRSR